MKMRVNICDFCDRQIETKYSIRLKDNTDSVFARKLKYDICAQCWVNMHQWVKNKSRKGEVSA